MRFQELGIQGLQLVQLGAHGDERGTFAEVYREDLFNAQNLKTRFIQFNRSHSLPGVVRGLHAQMAPPQSKWIQVLGGRIFDVVVDLRRESPTFGRAISLELSEEKLEALWVPAGCAHGFAVLGDRAADVFYAVDAYYNKEGERGIRWNDPALGIQWPYAQAQISPKDSAWPTFEDYQKSL